MQHRSISDPILRNRIGVDDYRRRKITVWKLERSRSERINHRANGATKKQYLLQTAIGCGCAGGECRAACLGGRVGGKKHSIFSCWSATSRGVANIVIIEKNAIDRSPLRSCMLTSGGIGDNASGALHRDGTPG